MLKHLKKKLNEYFSIIELGLAFLQNISSPFQVKEKKHM